jgi:acyl-CoA thioesterase FadM
MYPYFRLAKVLLAAQFGPRLRFDQQSELGLRIWPSDIDLYPEVNNGRHLTLMDLGRFDLAARTGLLRVLHRRRWGLTVGGASVRFRHRVPPFRPIRLRTKLVGRDDRWFYFHQEIARDGRVCSRALVRAGITARRGLVPVDEVLEATGQPGWGPTLPEWVRAWIEAENRRPWPPVADAAEGTDGERNR